MDDDYSPIVIFALVFATFIGVIYSSHTKEERLIEGPRSALLSACPNISKEMLKYVTSEAVMKMYMKPITPERCSRFLSEIAKRPDEKRVTEEKITF